MIHVCVGQAAPPLIFTHDLDRGNTVALHRAALLKPQWGFDDIRTHTAKDNDLSSGLYRFRGVHLAALPIDQNWWVMKSFEKRVARLNPESNDLFHPFPSGAGAKNWRKKHFSGQRSGQGLVQ